MSNAVVREDGSIKESHSSTTIRKITSATRLLIFLVTWVKNKIQELRSLYFLEDVRIPSRESARPGRDRTPVTRGNPLIMFGGEYVWAVSARDMSTPSKRNWTLHLSDGSRFRFNYTDLLKPIPHMPGGIVEQRAKKELVELAKALGYSTGMRDGKIVPVFGGYLQGITTGFNKTVEVEFSHRKKVMSFLNFYKMLVRIEARHRATGLSNEPVPNDPMIDAFLSRLNRLEEKRTNADSTAMDKDNSPEVYGDPAYRNPKEKYPGIGAGAGQFEFDDPDNLRGDPSIRHTGAQFGMGHVHPAFMIRIGKVMGIFKAQDNKDGTLTFEQVEPTIEVRMPWGDTRLKDFVLDGVNYVAFMNAVKRELRDGNTPFVIKSYPNGYPVQYNMLGGYNPDGTPILYSTEILLPRKEGGTVDINWKCTRTKIKGGTPCGSTTYHTWLHGIECTKCGGQLWRNKLIAFIPLRVPGRTIEDGVGRYINWDPEAGGAYVAIPMFGTEVGHLLRNMVRENFNPDHVQYRVNRKVKRIIGLQRFWDNLISPDGRYATPMPFKDLGLKPRIYQPGLLEFPEIKGYKYDPKKWLMSAAFMKWAKDNKLGLGTGGKDPGFVSYKKPKKSKLKGIKVRHINNLIREALKVVHKRRRDAINESYATILSYEKDAMDDPELEALIADGIVRVDYNEDGSINLD